MNLTPVFAPDAKSQWRELDVELQEMVLDEMEKLAAQPQFSLRPTLTADFVITRQSERHFVFLQYIVERRARRLVVTGVHHFVQK